MTLGQHPAVLLTGIGLLVAALLLWRMASRWDLKGLAADAAWQAARHRRIDAESDLARHVREIAADPSRVGQAKRVAGHAVRHVVAQVLTIAALLLAATGAAAIGFSIWRW